MKISIKHAVAAALAVGSVASLPAFADTFLPDTGNGELTLYVRNVTTDTTYVRGLNVRLDDLMTQAAIAGSGYAGTTQDHSSTISIGSLIHDSALTTFLGANPQSGNFQWAILAGDNVGSGDASNVNNVGELRYLTSTQSTIGGTSATGGKINSNLNTLFSGLEPNTQTPANAAINSGVNGDKASGVGPQGGIYTSSAQTWYGAGLNNVSNLGQAANLYLLATNGGANGSQGTNGLQAQVYQFASITLGLNGDLTSASTSSAPLPAAVWLFGSGLVGLAGIGRRRRENVA